MVDETGDEEEVIASPPRGPAKLSSKSTASSGCGVLFALLRKNWIVKKRHPYATLLELTAPLICILLFSILKTVNNPTHVPTGWSNTLSADSNSVDGTSWPLNLQTSMKEMVDNKLNTFGIVADERPNYSMINPSDNTASGIGSLSEIAKSPYAMMSFLSSLEIPNFYFTEPTMTGLMLNMALSSVKEAQNLNGISNEDLVMCFVQTVLFGHTRVPSQDDGIGRNDDVPKECHDRVIPYKIGIAPDTPYTRNYFSKLLEMWYPSIPLLPLVYGISPLSSPSFETSRIFFANESALEDYVTSTSYGEDIYHPRLYAALVFNDFPDGTSAPIGDIQGHPISYSIRMNSSSEDGSGMYKVPRTLDVISFGENPLRRSLKPGRLRSYSITGFMTLQTAVSRFLNCMPDWDPATQSTTGSCQISESTSTSGATLENGQDLDTRLLQQIENDTVVQSVIGAMTSLQKFMKVAKAAGVIEDIPGMKISFVEASLDMNLSIADMPAQSKDQLLQSFRQAPQPYHGAGIFVSPVEAYDDVAFFGHLLTVFPLGFLVSYLYALARMIDAFVSEKETHSKDLQRIIGAPNAYITFSWLITYTPIILAASLVQTMFSKLLLFTNSDFGLLLAFHASFYSCTCAFSYFISALFERTRTATVVGLAVYVITFFISFFYQETTGEMIRTVSCVFPPMSLFQAELILALSEEVSMGMTIQTMSSKVYNFRFSSSIYMQVFDTIFYFLLAILVDHIMHHRTGITRHLRHMLLGANLETRLAKFQSATIHTKQDSKLQNEELEAVQHTSVNLSPNNETPFIEPLDASDFKQQEEDGRAVTISNLRKEFSVPGGKKVAVQGLWLNLYEGQITCLLGHNGAGKTTLLSMLTGVTTPTSGDAKVNGYSVANDMANVRISLGYCPQHSVLYGELTVEEHLTFYARIKKIPEENNVAKEAIETKMKEVGLMEKRNVAASALSGGMQRRLSLAIALLGDSRVVILDEPTSGMDPYTRRSIWPMIRSSRRGRVIILTTHFMDEAEVLGDRIAILAEGELKCAGSVFFLKKCFDAGYRLSFVQSSESVGSNADMLRDLVLTHVEGSKLMTCVGTEVSFHLPFDATHSFAHLFQEIEKRQTELGILSFAISVTTLEEIFVKVASGNASVDGMAEEWDEKEKINSDDGPRDGLDMSSPDTTLKNDRHMPSIKLCRFTTQLHALILKRIRYARRDLRMFLFGMFLPTIVMVVGVCALNMNILTKNDVKLPMAIGDQFQLEARESIPFACTGNSGMDGWCESLFEPAYFHGGDPERVEMPSKVYSGYKDPSVFGVNIMDYSMPINDTLGYCVRFGELFLDRSLGIEPSEDDVAAKYGQQAGFLVYGSANERILSYNMIVNTSEDHTAPSYKAVMDQSIHRFLLSRASPTNAIQSNVTVKVASYPFPLTFKARSAFNSIVILPMVLLTVTSFTLVTGALMPFIVKEKYHEQNAKHLQLLSGMHLTAYWLANWVVDFVIYLFPMAAALITLRVSNITKSMMTPRLDEDVCSGCTENVPSAVMVLMLLFGAAVVPWTYVLSQYMKDPGPTFIYTSIVAVLASILPLSVAFVMGLFDSTKAIGDVLVMVYRLSPLFAFGNGLINLVLADITAIFGITFTTKNAFSLEIAGTDMLYLGLEAPIYFAMTIYMDKVNLKEIPSIQEWILSFIRLPLKPTEVMKASALTSLEKSELPDDLDVAIEANRVYQSSAQIVIGNGETKDDIVQFQSLRKVYPSGKEAVKGLSFGLKKGECFGFLGTNGAGKTTTMKMLTGDLLPTSGTALLAGRDIISERRKVRQQIGYCPQFDAHLDLLTVLEHLHLYSSLKGLRGDFHQQEVDRVLHKLGLQSFANKLAGSLSGGNKRKLSVAIAMLGEPPMLFLDEPSTGVDPFSRRFLWDVILDVSTRSKRSTVMLTTHSMEECEAVCGRVGIMTGGRLRCFGSIPHLKHRFGRGLLLECKFDLPSSRDISALVGKVQLFISEESWTHVSCLTLSHVCLFLGKEERAAWILEPGLHHATGSVVRDQMERNGDVLDLEQFCRWWLLEDRIENLSQFLKTCQGGVPTEIKLLDRQSDFCRWQMSPMDGESTDVKVDEGRPGDGSISPKLITTSACRKLQISTVFESLDAAKVDLGLKEYCLSHTTLEQIFQSLASSMDSSTQDQTV